jgi:hypothetical protein
MKSLGLRAADRREREWAGSGLAAAAGAEQ